jgi:hypothetical protein
MADVNTNVISGTIFDNPKFFSIKGSTLTVVYFTLACNRGVKKLDPGYMFNVTATLKRTELSFVSRGARVCVTGYLRNSTDDGIEKAVIHSNELISLPIDREVYP